MKFDLVITNPPFQDSSRRGKTPHKLWIDFTKLSLERLLPPGGSLVQVSPSSFGSPNSVVLEIMKENKTHFLRFGTELYFPNIGSSFSDYWIEKLPTGKARTLVEKNGEDFELILDSRVIYLPADLSELSLSIHSKVMFEPRPKLDVRWDYVVAHNIRRRGNDPSLSEHKTDKHIHPIFHTNRKTWWSSEKQDWASIQKVMWTRSGYTKPFFDDGQLGGTDMVYFVPVGSEEEGRHLAHNLQSQLFRYIFKTARWSGFGNERVFRALPAIPTTRKMTNEEIFDLFDLSPEEKKYIEASVD